MVSNLIIDTIDIPFCKLVYIWENYLALRKSQIFFAILS